MAAMSDRIEVIVTCGEEFLDFETARKVLGNCGRASCGSCAWGLSAARRSARGRFCGWPKCKTGGLQMYRGTNGNDRGGPTSMVVLRAAAPCSSGAVSADFNLGRRAVSVFNEQENPVGSHGGRRSRGANADALVFGGVCDRCGQLYLQCRFPHGCLCPTCALGSSKATGQGLLVAPSLFTSAGLGSS